MIFVRGPTDVDPKVGDPRLTQRGPRVDLRPATTAQLPQWGTQGGHKTDRPLGTKCCLGERGLGPQPLYQKRKGTLPIQFAQVLTNFWYRHTWRFVVQ